MELKPTRAVFIQFLEAMANGKATSEDWSRCIIEHYGDDLLEAVRCDVSRFMFDRATGSSIEAGGDRDRFQQWAEMLRAE